MKIFYGAKFKNIMKQNKIKRNEFLKRTPSIKRTIEKKFRRLGDLFKKLKIS